MTIEAVLPPKGRDYRLDLLRGFANWAIYLDHIPNNAVNWITQRNYGFSDAADLFVFISGYTASFVYARIILERGFVIGGTRLVKRAWQIYVAHIILFVMYIAEIGYLSQRYEARPETRSKRQRGRFQGTAPDGARWRYHQHPQRLERPLEAMAGSGQPLSGAVHVVFRIRHDRRQEGAGLVRSGRDSTAAVFCRPLNQLDQREENEGGRGHHRNFCVPHLRAER